MQKPSPQSLVIPISFVALAVLAAIVISVLSLGLLTSFGGVSIGLSLVLSGVWLLLNRRSTATRVVSLILIATPVVAVLANFVLEVTRHA